MIENNTIPTVLVTGASGFIGRHLVTQLCQDYRVVAFARRTQKEVGLEAHENLQWVLVDLMDREQLISAFHKISADYNLELMNLHLIQ